VSVPTWSADLFIAEIAMQAWIELASLEVGHSFGGTKIGRHEIRIYL
jgi:hypothetical protein